jgi:hypothetical protein
MSSFHRILLVCLACLPGAITAAGCAVNPARSTEALRIHPAWEIHMAAGLDAAEMGNLDAAAGHYRSALHVARFERLPAEELAFSAYRLGDLTRQQPDTARDESESPLALLDEARASFEHAYGAEHPILLPVWARIAQVHESAGHDEEANAARANADRIAVRFFPETHFLRERYGAARPAAIMHPLEVLALLAADEQGEPERVVQSPNYEGSGSGQ